MATTRAVSAPAKDLLDEAAVRFLGDVKYTRAPTSGGVNNKCDVRVARINPMYPLSQHTATHLCTVHASM